MAIISETGQIPQDTEGQNRINGKPFKTLKTLNFGSTAPWVQQKAWGIVCISSTQALYITLILFSTLGLLLVCLPYSKTSISHRLLTCLWTRTTTLLLQLHLRYFPAPAVQFSFTSVLPPNLFDNCRVNRLNPRGTLLIEWGSKFSFFQAYPTYQVACSYSCCQYLSRRWEDGGQMPVLGKG